MIHLGEEHDVRLELRIPGPPLIDSNSLDSASKKVLAAGAAKGAKHRKLPPSNSIKRINHGSSKRKVSRKQNSTKTLLLTFLSTIPTAMAQCVSLKGSTACSAFQKSSVSTDDDLVKL